MPVIKVLLQYGTNSNYVDNTGRTVLMRLIEDYTNCNYPVMQLLVDKGADINQQTNDGTTVLIYAIEENITYAVPDLIKLGANVNLTNNKGETPIMIATKNNEIDTTFIRFRRISIK